jgi:1-phosphofructokinase family hexose kinase
MTASFAKIITVTTNSAIDYLLEVDNLSLGDTAIAQNTQRFAAGKGINVAKAVASLACPVTALGFVGIQTQALFQELQSAFLATDFCFVAGETRTNITLFDSFQKQETHIRTAGFSVTAFDCQCLLDKLSACITQNDIVVFSGSLPSHAPIDFYQKLIQLCHQKAAIPFLDTSGASLELGLQAKPYLIKPNLAEFESLIGCRLSNEQAIVKAAREIIAVGVQCVVVSRAAQGAILVTESSVIVASISAIDDTILSYIGCGDVLVAGLAVAKLHKYNAEKSLEFAVACGAANLFSPEPGIFDSEKIAQMLTKIQIRVF